ncbi:hypothetical protein HGM15179_009895, partial [Zosterops borbonicus]
CPAPPSATPGAHPRVSSRGSCKGKAAVVPFPPRGEAVVAGGHKQMSQPRASRCLPHFLDAMLQHSQTFIKLPNTLQQQQKVNEGLYVIASFLSIQGVIDCIHIPTVAPVDNEMYRSRKPSHSMNMQSYKFLPSGVGQMTSFDQACPKRSKMNGGKCLRLSFEFHKPHAPRSFCIKYVIEWRERRVRAITSAPLPEDGHLTVRPLGREFGSEVPSNLSGSSG